MILIQLWHPATFLPHKRHTGPEAVRNTGTLKRRERHTEHSHRGAVLLQAAAALAATQEPQLPSKQRLHLTEPQPTDRERKREREKERDIRNGEIDTEIPG